MFTAEEIEECDIFPKKITPQSVIKCLIYSVIMITAGLLMYSFYSGRDFTSLLSMESLKYGTDSYFLEKIWQLDNRFDYNISDHYTKDINELLNDNKRFISDYVSKSLPLIVKNVSTLNLFDDLRANDTYLLNYIKEEREILVEKRTDPNVIFFKEGYINSPMSYKKFNEEGQNKARLSNLFINEYNVEELAADLKTKLNKIAFLKYLKIHSQGIKYSEGFDEMINPGHFEYTENLICQVEGEMDLMIISPLQRNCVYPYKKNYGPPNYSAINFFKAEYGRFPNFRDAHRLYITLSKGDCLYLPAFWWFSAKTEENRHFVYVKFEYKSHSRWVENIMRGLENNEF